MTIGFDEIQLKRTATGKVVVLVVRGKLSKEDYELFVPQLDWLIEKNGSISLLVELIDFQGWTLGALWADTRFAFKHFADIRKLAVVGEGKQWERGMTTFIKPFTKADVRYFETFEKDTAMKWLST